MRAPRTVLVAIVLLVAAGGCDSKTDDSKSNQKSKAADQEERAQFESDVAPYAVELPTGWVLESGNALNKHADLRASRNDRMFLIVIPQELPKLKGIEGPDVESLKQASLSRMKENVQNLEVEREGPITLEAADAVSVIAEGRADGNQVQYVAAYLARGNWGYQIVTWGPPGAQSELVDEMDAIIKGWQFTGDSLPSAAPDAEPSDASEQSFD